MEDNKITLLLFRIFVIPFFYFSKGTICFVVTHLCVFQCKNNICKLDWCLKIDFLSVKYSEMPQILWNDAMAFDRSEVLTAFVMQNPRQI